MAGCRSETHVANEALLASASSFELVADPVPTAPSRAASGLTSWTSEGLLADTHALVLVAQSMPRAVLQAAWALTAIPLEGVFAVAGTCGWVTTSSPCANVFIFGRIEIARNRPWARLLLATLSSIAIVADTLAAVRVALAVIGAGRLCAFPQLTRMAFPTKSPLDALLASP